MYLKKRPTTAGARSTFLSTALRTQEAVQPAAVVLDIENFMIFAAPPQNQSNIKWLLGLRQLRATTKQMNCDQHDGGATPFHRA